jgi:hypothetical protein
LSDRFEQQIDLFTQGDNLARLQNVLAGKALSIYKCAIGGTQVCNDIFSTLEDKLSVLAGYFGVIDDNPVPCFPANRNDIAFHWENFTGGRPRMHNELELSSHFSSKIMTWVFVC